MSKKKIAKQQPIWVSYVLIILGTGLVSVAVQNLYAPLDLVTGGFSGLAIIIKAVTANFMEGGVPLWLTNILLNIPVFIASYLLLGRKFVGRTIVGASMMSVWLYFLPDIDLAKGDFLLSAIFGGVFLGAGIGMVIRGHATTGGTDMVAALIRKAIPQYSVAQIMQILDGAIVVLGISLFGVQKGMYAIIAIFVTTKVSDAIVEGFNFSKTAYIITEKHQEVADAILKEIDRGCTGLKAKGMYTGEEKCMLFVVVSKSEIVKVKEVVAQIDPGAFIIVSDANDVLGEGFLQNTNDVISF